MTTVSGKDKTTLNNFIKILTDLPHGDDRPVKIILEERKVRKENWNSSKVGTIKWIGI